MEKRLNRINVVLVEQSVTQKELAEKMGKVSQQLMPIIAIGSNRLWKHWKK